MDYETFDHKQEFAGILRNITASLSWSQSILSRHLGVSRQLVGTFCSGTALPAARIMERILRILQEYSVDELQIQEILRHYVAGMFPESASQLIRKYLWESAMDKYESVESVMLQHLCNKSNSAVEKFFKYVMELAGCDCCCVFRHSGSNYSLQEHFHFTGDQSVKNELEALAGEHLQRWFHTLQPGTVLELEIDKDLSPLQCRSTKFHSGCFAFLCGTAPEGLPREAVALLYINHHPAYREQKIAILRTTMNFWKMHRERFDK